MRFKGLFIAIAAVCLLASCSKEPGASFLGTYHFKMSGNFVAAKEDGTTKTFVLSSQSGTLQVIHGQNDNYFVNMSVMLGGDVMSFYATIEDDVINLEPHTVIVGINEEGDDSGTLGLSSEKQVSLSLSGMGARYDDTIMFRIYCDGSFTYGEEAERYTVVPDSYDIICVANYLE